MKISAIVSAFLFGVSVAIGQTATAPSSGDGTAGSPYQIANIENLYWLTQNSTAWGKYFVQTADIDASGSSTWNSNQGFTPIGNYTTYFTGNYDGQGYTVDGIYRNINDDRGGLFGACDGATISNLGVTNVDITANYNTGGFVGYTRASTFSNCYSTGSVTSGAWYLGGFVGYSDGTSYSECYSTVVVNGGSPINDATGGFAGYLQGIASVDRCYASGSVTGLKRTGGFVGVVTYYVTVSDCYSRGNVARASGTETSFGSFYGESDFHNTTQRCYATGSVTYTGGTDPTDKGFAASTNLDTWTNNFFDSNVSGQSSGIGATAKITADMKTQSTFTDAGWDFEIETTNGTNDYWDIDGSESINNGYPFLSWQNGGAIALPVQMAAVNAEAEAERVVLTWYTVTEVDNAGFDVERRSVSAMGAALSAWMKIGFVEGHGTVSSPQSYMFTDDNVPSGWHEYRLKQVDRTGTYEYTTAMRVAVSAAPQVFSIGQNYPNPFNPSTVVSYTIATDGHVSLKIYDATGREVARLVDQEQKAGIRHEATFEASGMASGVYVAKLVSSGQVMTRKMILMK